MCYAICKIYYMEKAKIVRTELFAQIGISTGIILVVLIFLSYILSPSQALRIVSALIFALVLPGTLFGYILFKRGSIDAVERIVLSFVFSLVVVPLPIFLVSKIGIKITTFASFIVLLVLNVIFASVLLYQRKK